MTHTSFPAADTKREAAAPESEAEPFYPSDTAKSDCLLCGDGDGTLFPLYWGQDNIGIVSLNTFEVSQIGINRYDDNGRLIKEPSGGISTHINSHGEDFYFLCDLRERREEDASLQMDFDVFYCPERYE